MTLLIFTTAQELRYAASIRWRPADGRRATERGGAARERGSSSPSAWRSGDTATRWEPFPVADTPTQEQSMPSSDPDPDRRAAMARLVLVQHDTVVQTFPFDDGGHAHRTAGMIALATGQPVDLYEVDGTPRGSLAVGSRVDPRAAGWSRIGQEPA